MVNERTQGVLSRYSEIRQELIADLELMTEVMRRDIEGDGDEFDRKIQEKIDRRLKLLKEDRLTMGIFGETCSGKSTLINTLSKREVTRPDVLSNTGVIMEFEYGDEEHLEVHFLDGRVQETTWDEVPNYTDQLNNPENEKMVSKVRIQLPLDYLKNGIKFYDTPGLNDVIRSYSNLSTRFLDEMGAVIITSLYPPFTRGEHDFLKRASNQCGKLFIVVNLSSDYWPQRDRLKQRVISNILRDPDLRNHPDLKPEKLRIFVLNAYRAWQAVQNNDEEELKASGFTDFQEALEKFLAQDASRAVLASSIRSSFEVLTLLQKLLTLRSQLLFSKRGEIEAKIKELKAARRRVDLKKYELFDAIDGEIENLLKKLLPQVEEMVDQTTIHLKEIRERKVFGKMADDIERLYRHNLEHGAELERILSRRIEAIFQATQRWLNEQLDEMSLFGEPQDSPETLNKPKTRPFALSRAQKALLGLFDGYEDKLGLAEAVVGVTTLGATMAAGGQGMALLSFLGPLAFPVGGVGGFFVGMFARNFMKANALRQHIDEQIRQIEGSRELLPDKLHLVLDRISQGVKNWVNDYFDQLFARISSIMEQHREQLGKKGYIESQRAILELRQEGLDKLRDHFIERLSEIRSLLQQ